MNPQTTTWELSYRQFVALCASYSDQAGKTTTRLNENNISVFFANPQNFMERTDPCFWAVAWPANLRIVARRFNDLDVDGDNPLNYIITSDSFIVRFPYLVPVSQPLHPTNNLNQAIDEANRPGFLTQNDLDNTLHLKSSFLRQLVAKIDLEILPKIWDEEDDNVQATEQAYTANPRALLENEGLIIPDNVQFSVNVEGRKYVLRPETAGSPENQYWHIVLPLPPRPFEVIRAGGGPIDTCVGCTHAANS